MTGLFVYFRKPARTAWLMFLVLSVGITVCVPFTIGHLSPILWPFFYAVAALLSILVVGLFYLLAKHPKRCAHGFGIVMAVYIGLYFLNALFGGYDPYFTSDGRSRHSSGLLMHDCVVWQPRFGSYYNEYRHDFIGLGFYPLLWIDGQFFHKTYSIADDNFPKWWESLTAADIHPLYRADYTRWKTVEQKYKPQLDAAIAHGDTNEVRRIRKLMRIEEDTPQ